MDLSRANEPSPGHAPRAPLFHPGNANVAKAALRILPLRAKRESYPTKKNGRSLLNHFFPKNSPSALYCAARAWPPSWRMSASLRNDTKATWGQVRRQQHPAVLPPFPYREMQPISEPRVGMSKAVNVLVLGSEGCTSAVMHIRPDRQDLFPMARAPCLPAGRRAGRLARRRDFVPRAGLFAWAVTMTRFGSNVPTPCRPPPSSTAAVPRAKSRQTFSRRDRVRTVAPVRRIGPTAK
jgi:hypothetical protein